MFVKFSQSCYRLSTRLRNISPRAIALIIAAISVLILSFFSPLKAVFDPILFKSFIQQYEGYVKVTFITIYIVLTVIGVPGTVLTVVGGCLFGIWCGKAD